jgi:ABC-type multidrug transport system ATPase subunit
MTKREIESKLDKIIAFSGLEEFIDTPVKRYSSGMYARLGFSVAAHVDPDVLIVDEVLSVGDDAFQQKCLVRMKEVVSQGATVLLVSHNLKTIVEFCHRCLLLDHGRVLMNGPAEKVICDYLERSRTSLLQDSSEKSVMISEVTMRDERGECHRFQSGQKAWLDVKVTARERCSKIALAIFLKNADCRDIMDTSTERLGHGNVNLEAGEVFECTFELSLNVVSGIYHIAVLIFRYDTQTRYDNRDPGATFYVSSQTDVRSIVHCFPKVIRHEIIAEPGLGAAALANRRERPL